MVLGTELCINFTATSNHRTDDNTDYKNFIPFAFQIVLEIGIQHSALYLCSKYGSLVWNK